LLLFNIQGFFNNVNHSRLTALIESLGFTPEICRWTASFLKDRSIHMQFNSFTSEEIELEMGTPQGSPISPILSIIYTSPLLHLAKQWTDTSSMMYINDGNIIA
jgi:retron-type reverse transcriptase